MSAKVHYLFSACFTGISAHPSWYRSGCPANGPWRSALHPSGLHTSHSFTRCGHIKVPRERRAWLPPLSPSRQRTRTTELGRRGRDAERHLPTEQRPHLPPTQKTCAWNTPAQGQDLVKITHCTNKIMAEHQRIDAFELWYWRRLSNIPWTARRSNQSFLKEISPGCSLEGLTLKLKF